MFETKKTKYTKSYSFKMFPGLPWVFSAYIILLVMMLISFAFFSGFDAIYNIPMFKTIADKIVSFLEIIFGAVIGALSTVVTKNYGTRD